MRRACWVLACVLAGCDGGSATLDAGPPDGGMNDGIDEAALPRLAPCPSGWSEVDVGGTRACHPYGGGEPSECPSGEARWPGTVSCAPVGGACPSGAFADDLPATGVLYVQPGASGDGTREAPFGTIAEALSRAARGSTIALARGVHEGPIALASGVTVRGACAAETVLSVGGAAGGQTVAVAAGVTDAVLADLRIADTARIGVLARGAVRLEGVVIDEAMLFGVAVLGGSVVAEELVVRDTRRAPDGTFGGGVVVTENGSFEGTRVVLHRNHQFAMAAAGARATVRDVSVRDTREGDRPGLGAALVAEGGATLIAERAELGGSLGASVLATGGASVELREAWVHGTRGVGAQQGFGVSATASVLRVERTWVHDAQGTAVLAVTGSRATLIDVLVSGTVETPSLPGWAVGVSVQASEAELERVRVVDAAAGAYVVQSESILTGRDLSVWNVEARGLSGVGLYLSDDVEATVTRLSIERATEAAIIANASTRLTLAHALVRDTRGNVATGEFGRGLELLEGSSLELAHARFEMQREVALIFSGGRATLRDVRILDTEERGCVATTCPGQGGGIGLGVYRDAIVDVEGFAIDGAALCGVQIGIGGQLDLRDGEIARAAVGACVQVPDYDLARLTSGVAYRDNGTSVQATSHYIPDARDPFAP